MAESGTIYSLVQKSDAAKSSKLESWVDAQIDVPLRLSPLLQTDVEQASTLLILGVVAVTVSLKIATGPLPTLIKCLATSVQPPQSIISVVVTVVDQTVRVGPLVNVAIKGMTLVQPWEVVGAASEGNNVLAIAIPVLKLKANPLEVCILSGNEGL